MTLKDFVDRYGPTMAVVLGLALIIAILPGNNQRTTLSARGGANGANAAGFTAASDESSTAVGAGGLTAEGGQAGATGAAAGASGGVASAGKGPTSVAFGKGKCRPDGREYGISGYMPPCVDFHGDNGGATNQGVTKDKVLIVRFISQVDPATRAILQGANLADDPAVVKRAYTALFKYANQHYQTYGREVVFQDYNASGLDTNDEAMKSDAQRIAKDIKAFAVWGGPKVFGRELAALGVPCMCTVTLSSDFYSENPPYIFGSLPTSTEYAQMIAEYIGKRAANKPAKYSGDTLSRNKTRKFGLIYIEGQKGVVDPEGKRLRDALVKELAKYGVTFCNPGCEWSYLYEPGSNQDRVSAMISGLKGAGVTTVLMFTDPLYPILITLEATRQTYFP
jgi:hypothetical protein